MGVSVTDAITGERVYSQNPQQMFIPGSITKIFQGSAALESYGPDYRFRTPVHRIGAARDGRLRGTLSLVASGDFSFGLRDRKGGTLDYADGGADPNEADSLGFVKSVSGDPLKALDALACDVRRSGATRATEAVLVDDPQSFARTAFIEALERAGVQVDAAATGDNPTGKLPSSRSYPASTRLGEWTSPRFDEYVKVVFKVSYNRGADLLACLVGARAGI